MILSYHHVVPEDAVPSDPTRRRIEGWDFRVTPGGLDRHLRLLVGRGFRLVSLDRLVERLADRGREDLREAVVTFDDGWTDQFEHALPVLQRHGAPATFFVPSGDVAGVPGHTRMGPEQLRRLLSCGMAVGGHSRTHVRLSGLAPDRLADEIAGNRRDLEDLLGVPVRHFAYPGGAFDRAAVRAVEAAGYASACCSLGPAVNRVADRFHLFRVGISDSACTWRDRVRWSPVMARLLGWRAAGKAGRRLR